MPKDYYESLGVKRNASDEEIKKAFRSQAMQCHPDRNKGDKTAETRFREVNEAYEVLKNPEKRGIYDRLGHQGLSGTSQGGRGGGFEFNFGAGFSDIFDEMFGDLMGRRNARGDARAHGSDFRYNMTIALEDAFHGKQVQIRIPGSAKCETCDGSGAARGTRRIECASCGGRGVIRTVQGFLTIERNCGECRGQGSRIEHPCSTCKGSGQIQRERTIAINIPAGVGDGTRIRLAGEGEAGMNGAPNGDLYVFLSVKPHGLFQRDGNNLYCRVPLPMTTAALGGPVEAPTIEGGRALIELPAGAQTGARFRLRGKGMPLLRGQGRGDMYVEVVVETPVNLSKRQRELLSDFDQAGDRAGTSPESEGFFSRVREFWDDLRE